MNIKFTQYLLPDGRQRIIYLECPDGLQSKAQELTKNNCRFETEILHTGHISMTVENHDSELLSIQLCDNDPTDSTGLDNALADLINEASKAFAAINYECELT